MASMEMKETDEGTKGTAETHPLETPEAREVLEPTEHTLIDSMESLSPGEKLDAFRELESKCADLEGRDPRAVEYAVLEGKGVFHSSMEKVEVDKSRITEWKVDEAGLSGLKKHVFSTSDARLNHGATVSFGRTCSQKCIDCDVKSGDCRWG